MLIASTGEQRVMAAAIREWAKRAGTIGIVRQMEPGGPLGPLREITGRAVFSEVFLDNVFVPDGCVLGEPGQGWQIARATLAAERVAMGRGSPLGDAVEGLLSAIRAAGLAADPRVPDRAGALVAGGLAGSLLDLRCIAGSTTQILLSVVAGRIPGLPGEEVR